MSSEVAQLPDRGSARSIVAANLRAEMARQRRSGKAVAAQVGLSPTALSRRLTGVLPFTIDEAADVAAVLGVDLVDLMPKRKNAPHPVGPDGAQVASRLGESNPRPIHYKDRKASVVSLAEERARRNAAAEVERIEARA